MTTEAVLPDLDATLPFQQRLGSFRERLDDSLAAWFDSRRDEIEPVGGATDLDRALAEFVFRGGKRVRPALVYHAYRACGGDDENGVMALAMAVELLHTYLLVHDDIMDRAETRRGAAAVHIGFECEHRARSWHGDAGHYGEAVATLVGDLAHSYAVELFSEAAESAPATRALRDCFHGMCREVIIGQYLELGVGNQESPSASDLRSILQLKSARYSVERPLQLGAIFAGAAEDRLTALSAYGLAMGEAFQLQDDLLGMFGDPGVTGKPVGEDLSEGKYTFLVYHAMERADEEERALVRAALGNPEVSAGTIERVCRLLIATGARDEVVGMVERRLTRAGDLVAEMELDADDEEFFSGLIDYLRGRNR
jgi:geranylgeranyl diphosphate synthase type I